MHSPYGADEETRAAFEDHVAALNDKYLEAFGLMDPAIARVLQSLLALFKNPDAFKVEYCYEEFSDLLCNDDPEEHGRKAVDLIFHIIPKTSEDVLHLTRDMDWTSDIESWQEYIADTRREIERYCTEARETYKRISDE
eukprot:6180783-Pleurochrysis_carterae.AAC.1